MKRLVVENIISHGYRGYASRSIKLECGHYYMADVFGRERKYKVGKTKMECWKCNKIPQSDIG